MINLIHSILILSLCLTNTLAKGQDVEAIDCLCETADEILLINIVEDKPDIYGGRGRRLAFPISKQRLQTRFRLQNFPEHMNGISSHDELCGYTGFPRRKIVEDRTALYRFPLQLVTY